MRFEDARLERAITEWRAAARAATRAMLDNYCFEERASDKRREAFEQYALTAGALEELLRAHSNYWSDFVRVDQDIPHTFASEFKPADLGALDPAQWIVRVESLLRPLNKFGITFDELNAAFIGNQTDFLDNFLRTWNNSNIRDWRPTFAVFYDEVADDCDIDEWPHRLRDRLGLAHYSGPDRTPNRINEIYCSRCGGCCEGFQVSMLVHGAYCFRLISMAVLFPSSTRAVCRSRNASV